MYAGWVMLQMFCIVVCVGKDLLSSRFLAALRFLQLCMCLRAVHVVHVEGGYDCVKDNVLMLWL